MKSPVDEQRRLIDLQDHDLQLARLDYKAKTLPLLKELEHATQGFESHEALTIASETERSDIEVELNRSASDVEQVEMRISKDQQVIDSGQASAKDLQNLLGELDSLRRRKAELEEVELEIMVRIEDAASRKKHHEIERDRFKVEVDRLSKACESALAEIRIDREQVQMERESIAKTLSKELLDLYLKIKDSNGGIGAARLKDGKCEGCHLGINAVELNRIKSLPDDELVRCEECRRILVRV